MCIRDRVYSHGGLNAAPVEAAIYAKERGLSVVAVTSLENHKKAKPTHSSGKKLGDLCLLYTSRRFRGIPVFPDYSAADQAGPCDSWDLHIHYSLEQPFLAIDNLNIRS